MDYKRTPCAKWTMDCQGKQDYDGRLLSISCRYWPGGGYLTYKTSTGEMETIHDGNSPSAHVAIVLNSGEPDNHGFGDSLTLSEREFAGKDEADVKRQVEEWVQQKFEQISTLVSRID